MFMDQLYHLRYSSVNEMGENINHDSNTNIKAFLIRFWLKISTKQEDSVSIIAYTFS